MSARTDELSTSGTPTAGGYKQFCVHYREWLGRQDPVMRLPHVAGEKMEVDFSGDTVAVTDASSGEVWQAQVFVAVLGASGYLYGRLYHRPRAHARRPPRSRRLDAVAPGELR